MKIILFGGDGFCGWPTALHLSQQGHDILIADNLSRRAIDAELGVDSLTPIATPDERLAAWKDISGRTIEFTTLDVAAEYERLEQLLRDWRPDAIVHFAEQRAAPYSMKSAKHKRYTVDNNIGTTHNLLCAVVESGLDIHFVHLGTMGVYGYGGCKGAVIPEGYLSVDVTLADGKKFNREILHPADPGSIYHMTKTLDQLLFFYYNKNDAMRITDLHQGIVWGTNTAETRRDPRLVNRFDYDGDYGTVLNRFLVESAVGHPLTVHGSGGQTRAFIHIQDTVRCIELALAHPPGRGERVKILNQMTETHRVRDLAKLVSELTGARIQYLDNPRKEAVENDLIVDNHCFLDMKLKPIRLEAGLLEEIIDVARKWSHRCDVSKIPCTSHWVKAEWSPPLSKAAND